MCEYGNYKNVSVNISAEMSAEGVAKTKLAKIDSCLADIVNALQRGGINMLGSCCGHGSTIGDIQLEDGRVLLPLPKKVGRRWMAADLKDRLELLSALMGERR